MDILILGNGFDLAHELPTKYLDFLEFCQRVWRIWDYHVSPGDQTEAFKKEYIDNWKTEEYIRSEIAKEFHARKVELTEMYPKQEYADYYRAGALKRMEKRPLLQTSGPPWLSDASDLKTYAWRGARQLDSRCYRRKCFQCKWAAMANVSIEYNWDTDLQKHRFESFCYGLKSCSFYRMGPSRAVPCKGMDTAYDDGCLDEIITESRGYDD